MELNNTLDAIPTGLVILDCNKVISYINKAAAKILNIKKDVSGKDIQLVLSNDDEILKVIIECIRSREIVHYNNLLFISNKDKDNYLISIVNNDTYGEVEAESVQSIIDVQEKERKRLAKEIHDGIGPLLSAVKLNLESFQDENGINDNVIVPREKIDSLSILIDNIASDLRGISHALMPRVLTEFGLVPAFENLCTQINSAKSNLQFFTTCEKETRYDTNIELNLYRIGQELITNALKHAKASEIHLQLIEHSESLVLIIEDNGIGFSPDDYSDAHHTGIGLTSIDTRAKAMGGEFIIDSVKKRGTTVTIEVPIE